MDTKLQEELLEVITQEELQEETIVLADTNLAELQEVEIELEDINQREETLEALTTEKLQEEIADTTQIELLIQTIRKVTIKEDQIAVEIERDIILQELEEAQPQATEIIQHVQNRQQQNRIKEQIEVIAQEITQLEKEVILIQEEILHHHREAFHLETEVLDHFLHQEEVAQEELLEVIQEDAINSSILRKFNRFKPTT